MSRRHENWLLVEWSSGGRDVVYSKSVLNPVSRELKIGDVLTVNRRGEAQGATLIARAKERDELDPRPKETATIPSPKPEDEPKEYSNSSSSWTPSDDGAMSGDSDKGHISAKKMKLENTRQYINRKSTKKVLTPCYRANAVIPKSMQDNSKKNDRKRPHKDRNGSFNKSAPDSTKKNNSVKSDVGRRWVTIDARELEEIGKSFQLLFSMLEDLKRPVLVENYHYTPHIVDKNAEGSLIGNFDKSQNVEHVTQEETVIQAIECEDHDEYDHEEEFNRSDDNVLITNKYESQYNVSIPMKERVKTKKSGQTTDTAENEWVPIGSGKTLIHMDQFRKVNWKSYTIATRTLLLAVFPRRILATHSLTGKRSPAFQNKPAKMCLDPKIISDVIMEITDKFDVKENLVRSIITTKCADECKMLKQKTKKKASTSKNQENEPPKREFQDSKPVVK